VVRGGELLGLSGRSSEQDLDCDCGGNCTRRGLFKGGGSSSSFSPSSSLQARSCREWLRMRTTLSGEDVRRGLQRDWLGLRRDRDEFAAAAAAAAAVVAAATAATFVAALASVSGAECDGCFEDESFD